jgi:hypothetical protein
MNEFFYRSWRLGAAAKNVLPATSHASHDHGPTQITITPHTTLHCPKIAWEQIIRHELNERLSTYNDIHPPKLLALGLPKQPDTDAKYKPYDRKERTKEKPRLIHAVVKS